MLDKRGKPIPRYMIDPRTGKNIRDETSDTSRDRKLAAVDESTTNVQFSWSVSELSSEGLKLKVDYKSPSQISNDPQNPD